MNIKRLTNPAFVTLGFCLLVLSLATGCGGSGSSSGDRPPGGTPTGGDSAPPETSTMPDPPADDPEG